jgi:hypothetical protein
MRDDAFYALVDHCKSLAFVGTRGHRSVQCVAEDSWDRSGMDPCTSEAAPERLFVND